MEPGRVVDGRFTIQRLAGAGGMGSVYRALDGAQGTLVALKLLAETADRDRFAREVSTLAELRHPSIVRFVAHGVVDETPYLAMEWLEGEDLASHLTRGPLSIEDSVAVGKCIGRALGHAHARGIVHRDVKPSNVFLPGSGPTDARLVDFGIARPSAAMSSLTQTGALIGTPGYMAPEQARGVRAVDARTDVFALGCVLFECLTGQAAFTGPNVLAVLAKIIIDDAPRASSLRADVPTALDELLARMLAKDPSARPTDGDAVARAFDALRTVSPPVVAPGRPSGLGAAEQRFITVILAGAPEREGVSLLETLPQALLVPTLSRLRELLDPFEGSVATLLDGSIVCVLSGLPSAVDQAVHAARGALRLRRERADVSVAVATGRARLDGRLPLGEAIDRAARLVRAPDVAGSIRVDDLTVGLLGADFVVEGDAASLLLVGERESLDDPRPLLGRRSPCVGREKDLAYMLGVFDECVLDSVARALLVTAPPGAGKTRLRQEVTAKIASRAEVWIARGDPLSAGSPLELVGRLLRRAAGVFDGEELGVQRQKLRARVARNVRSAEDSRVTMFVGELASVPFGDADVDSLRAARADPLVMSDSTRAAWLDLIDAETATRPLVLVLEDVHWGDRTSLDYVHAALKQHARRPLMVLAFARPEVHQTFPALWADRDAQEIKLRGLGPRAAARLVRAALGDAIDEDTVTLLVERAGGNAFYLEELIRSRASGAGDALPATILAMAQSRLDGLDGEDRRVLRAASIVGEVFWRGALSHLLGVTHEGSLDARLDALADRELLTRHATARFVGEAELSFRHALVREAAYAALTPEDCALGHRGAAEWLEGAGERDPMTLALHHERGGARARAVEWVRRAAEQALERDDFDAALGRVARGIECGAKGESLGALRLVEASVHDWRGENAAAVQRGREAMEHLPAKSAAWHRAAATVAVASRRMGDRDALADVGRVVLLADWPSQPGGVELQSAARIALQLGVSGVRELSRALIDRVSAFHEVLAREPVAWAWSRAANGILALFAGDPTLLLEDGDAMLDAVRTSGDQRSTCNLQFFVGVAAQTAGALTLSADLLRTSAAASARLGGWTLYLITQKELASTLIAADRAAEALPIALETIAAAAAQRDLFQECTAHEIVANALAALGRVEEAEAEARLAVDQMEAAPPFRGRVLSTYSRVLRLVGRPSEALEAAARAGRFRGEGAVWDAAIDLAHAEALLACGDRTRARSVARAGDAKVKVLARRFVHSSWAERFLAQPHHARLARLTELE